MMSDLGIYVVLSNLFFNFVVFRIYAKHLSTLFF